MDFIIRLAEEFFKKHKRLARYRRIFALLAAVVVFATTYELILPAITMDRQRAYRSPGVEVGVAKDQRKGIEFAEDDLAAADTAGEDAFEAGFQEEGDFFEDGAGAAGDSYAEDFAADGNGSADDWMQAENPGAGDTWENADEIVPGADSAGDDYSGSDEAGSLTDADGTGVNASAGDDLAGVPSDSSDPENSGADISVPENAENDNTDESADLTDGNGIDSEEAGLEGTGSASHEDGQDLETADGEDSEDASDVSSENISGDNTQDASTGASAADSKETDEATDKNSNKSDTASGSTTAGSTTAGSGEAVIEGGTAETAVEFAQDGAAAGATDLAALDATGQAAAAITYPATIIYEGKDYTVTATFDEKAKLPAEVTLSAVEILPNKVYKDENGNPLYADYEEYYQKTLEALEKEKRLDDDQTVKSARFFDITFLDKEGKAVEPAAPVSIAVKYKDALSAVDTADTMAVHFEGNKAGNSADANEDGSEDYTEVIDNKDSGNNNENKAKAPADITVPEILDTKTEVKKKTIQEISFEAESFSVYGVIGTEVIEKTVLASDGHNYKITVTYGPEAGIPQGAELEVEEIPGESEEYKKYVTGTEDILAEDEKVSFARFFDIRIVKDNQEIQPAESVNVRIELTDELTKEVKAVHFEHQKDSKKAAEDAAENIEKAVLLDSKLVAAEELRNAVSFDADGFSVYGIIGTETITVDVQTASGNTLKVTVEVNDENDVARLEGLKVDELSSDNDKYWKAYDAVVAAKAAEDKEFDAETFGFFATDIELLDANGESFEPDGSVKVTMELINLPADEDTLVSTMEVQHLAETDGTVKVQTVATTNEINKVDEVIKAEFSVDSFSTFTLTWTGDGSSEVISDDDARVGLNINDDNGTTYATVKLHYVDKYGNNIRKPDTAAVNGDTPVDINALFNNKIEGYEYRGAYYSSYKGENDHGEAVSEVSSARKIEEKEGSVIASRSYSTNGYVNENEFSSNTDYYENSSLTQRLYWRYSNYYRRYYFYTSENGYTRYNGDTVYYASTGMQTYYTTSVTFSNGEEIIATLTSGATTSTDAYETNAEIFLVYENTDGSQKHATIHFGTLNPDGSFTELEESSSLDTNAASISLNSTISGYEYVGAYYSENATNTPSADTVEIMSVLRKVEDSWQYTGTDISAEKGFVQDGNHIYVSFKQKTGTGTPTPSQGEIPKPSTIKNVTDNGDGTYDIQLDIIGQQITHEETKGANVLLIFDRTSSMVDNNMGSITRLQAAKNAVHTLVDALNPSVNPVQMAVFSFDRNANSPLSVDNSYWTTSGTAITDFTDALTGAPSGATPGGGGTNWEAAFAQAKTVLSTADSDPTYVIFLTDGNPTFYVGATQVTSSTTSSQNYTRARTEASGLDSRFKLYGVLCANASDGPLLTDLMNDLASATYGSHDTTHILADNETTLTNTFNNIASHIVEQLGASNVSINDGVTSLSSVSASVSGAAGAFTYYKAYEVSYSDEKYTYVDDNGNTQEISSSDVNTYSYIDDEGDEQSYLYYNRVVWNEAPGASYNQNTGVTWDLSSESTLKEGAIYSIRFTIWPSQAAYDLLADLNNGLKRYDENAPGSAPVITAEERAQVYESDGVYYMKTNTNLDTTYSYDGQMYSDSIPYHQGAMNLSTETIKVRKNWPENMLDEYGAATYRDENGVEHTATEIKLTVTRDKNPYLDVLLAKSEGVWEKDDIFISCGVMTVENGVVDIKEHGHDYTVTEPKGFSYYWDLIAQVYHPMVINSVTTMLVLDEDASADDVDNVNYYEIDGKIYRKNSSATDNALVADNYRRSNLNLTKKIDPQNANIPSDSWFTYKATITDAESTDGYVWFSAYDPTIPWDDGHGHSGYGDVVMDWQVTGANKEIKDGVETGYWYAPNGGEITFSIKAGWNIRFLNLKHDSTFTFEETGAPEGFSFVSIGALTDYDFVNEKNANWYDEPEGTKITGTITEPNNAYTIAYTNRYNTIDVQLKKVDKNGNALPGSVFELNRMQGTIWSSVQTDIKPGDAATSTSNPVDLGGLGIGKYKLVETHAPDGYIILSNFIFFEVYKDGTELKSRLTDENGDPLTSPTNIASMDGPGTGETPTYIIEVTNTPGERLPMTGGSGTLFYTLSGLALIIASALMYIFRMRRRERRLR